MSNIQKRAVLLICFLTAAIFLQIVYMVIEYKKKDNELPIGNIVSIMEGGQNRFSVNGLGILTYIDPHGEVHQMDLAKTICDTRNVEEGK